MLSSKEYVAKAGAVCPFCGDWDIEGDDLSTDDGAIFQQVRCNSCGGEWTDEYSLVQYHVGEEV